MMLPVYVKEGMTGQDRTGQDSTGLDSSENIQHPSCQETHASRHRKGCIFDDFSTEVRPSYWLDALSLLTGNSFLIGSDADQARPGWILGRARLGRQSSASQGQDGPSQLVPGQAGIGLGQPGLDHKQVTNLTSAPEAGDKSIDCTKRVFQIYRLHEKQLLI